MNGGGFGGGGNPFGRRQRSHTNGHNFNSSNNDQNNEQQAKFSNNLNLVLYVMCFLWMFFSLIGGGISGSDMSYLYNLERTQSQFIPKKTSKLNIPFYSNDKFDQHVKNNFQNNFSQV